MNTFMVSVRGLDFKDLSAVLYYQQGLFNTCEHIANQLSEEYGFTIINISRSNP